MKFENVTDAVWTATAILAYNEYFRGLHNGLFDTTKFYFKQPDIIKKAQELCKKDVQFARTSQWYSADHQGNSHNFLRSQGALSPAV
ncbi:hypothetical protein [Paenibacillus ihuae]|uniref:hypothetical protein n=1 Tax=Paenibacillus ihuae TaxID=1232431 RepID=UPI0006D58B5C|nr:hypothetical protein [Paenibacillus ihuae]